MAVLEVTPTWVKGARAGTKKPIARTTPQLVEEPLHASRSARRYISPNEALRLRCQICGTALPLLRWHSRSLRSIERRRGLIGRTPTCSRWSSRTGRSRWSSRTRRSRGSNRASWSRGPCRSHLAFCTRGTLLPLRAGRAHRAWRTSFATSPSRTTFSSAARWSDLSLGASWANGARFARFSLRSHRSCHPRRTLGARSALRSCWSRWAYWPGRSGGTRRALHLHWFRASSGKSEQQCCGADRKSTHETTPRDAAARELSASG